MNEETLKKDATGIKNFFGEFKAFINKGNVVDLAVAVVIGAAFSKIVNSIVSGLITPFIGLLTGGIDLSHQYAVIRQASGDRPELRLNYGEVIQSSIDFLIVAFSIFVILRLLIKMRLKAEEKPAPAPVKSPEVTLLEEIRDLLKNDKGVSSND